MIGILTRVRQQELTGRQALLASLAGAALTAACSQIAFYLPGNPVPVTMQVFAAILCGLVLGSRWGALAQLEYLVAGAAGLPVFAGFKAGPAAILGPTGGYIVSFAAAAYVTGVISQRMRTRGVAGASLAGLAGVAVIYLTGRAWFGIWLGDATGIQSWLCGVAPFIGLDVAKVVLAAALCSRRVR